MKNEIKYKKKAQSQYDDARLVNVCAFYFSFFVKFLTQLLFLFGNYQLIEEEEEE